MISFPSFKILILTQLCNIKTKVSQMHNKKYIKFNRIHQSFHNNFVFKLLQLIP